MKEQSQNKKPQTRPARRGDEQRDSHRHEDSKGQGGSPRGTKAQESGGDKQEQKGKPSRGASGPPSRETTFELKKRQQKEKNERLFKSWQAVKEEARDDEIARLKEKIGLQQELIRVQDEHHQQKVDKQRHREARKREQDKAERTAKADALLQVCKESLKEEKRKAAEKAASSRQEKLEQEQEHASVPKTIVDRQVGKRTQDADNDQSEEVSPPDTAHQSLASAPIQLHSASQEGTDADDQFEVVREEEEDDAFGDVEEEVLPWHHVQLYRLYGQDADYFLHPKIEAEAKTPLPINPRIRAKGGRAGAGTLWNILRNESRMRLVHQDTKLLSPELRFAFGSFAREGLAKKQKPVSRNFSEDDVPDIDRLLDQSRVHDAQDFRHKTELMFRSSTINQDRTRVLLHNNPPPNLNNWEGEESVERYMPSWSEEWDTESELSYKKWLHPKIQQDTKAIEYDAKVDPKSTLVTSQTLSQTDSAPNEWDVIDTRKMHRKTTKKDEPKYLFLTEADTTVPGEFSKRRKELEEAKHFPHAHKQEPVVLPQKSHSALAGLIGGDTTSRSSSLTSSVGKQSGSQRARSEMSHKVTSEWQPLSLGALLEYKDNRHALGQGKFNQGKTSVWPTGEPMVMA